MIEHLTQNSQLTIEQRILLIKALDDEVRDAASKGISFQTLCTDIIQIISQVLSD